MRWHIESYGGKPIGGAKTSKERDSVARGWLATKGPEAAVVATDTRTSKVVEFSLVLRKRTRAKVATPAEAK